MLGLSGKKHSKKLVVGGIITLGLLFAVPATSPHVYADPAAGGTGQTPTTPTQQTPASQTQQTQTPSNANDSSVTCAVQKIGWILCPVIEMSAKFGDAAFGMLANNFLSTEPELIATSTNGNNPSGTMQAWNQARNLANILFIIAFLIIIISQLTGYGVSNYGIKKMIPRLVIAAIAVNVSYYICQIMVDLSNIAGFALEDMLNKAAISVTQQSAMPIPTSGQASGNTLGVIAIAALGIAAAIYLIPVMISGILMILVTCLVILFILMLRKAIIVLLVVFSPLAFVAYLLPNTEKFFSRWLKMFTQLLMVFPIVGLLLGGGQLASRIVLVAGAGQDQYNLCTNSGASANTCQNKCVNLNGSQSATGDCAAGSASIMLGIIAAGVAVAPLIATYSVLKGAISSVNSINGRVQGLAKSAIDGRKKRTKEDMEYNQMMRQRQAMQGRGVWGTRAFLRSSSKRKALHDYEKGRHSQAYTGYIAGKAIDDNDNITRFGRKLAGGSRGSAEDQDAVRANALNAQRKIQEEEIKAAHTIVDNMSPDALIQVTNGQITGGALQDADRNSAHTAAMIERAFKVGSAAEKAALINAFTRGDLAKGTLAARAVGSSVAGDNLGFSASNIDNMTRGLIDPATTSAESMALQGLKDNRLNAENMAGANGGDLDWWRGIGRGDATASANLIREARKVIATPQLNAKLKTNTNSVTELNNGIV